jgi:hypothetical protein
VLGEGGLPESLEQWLKDNKEKVIGTFVVGMRLGL